MHRGEADGEKKGGRDGGGRWRRADHIPHREAEHTARGGASAVPEGRSEGGGPEDGAPLSGKLRREKMAHSLPTAGRKRQKTRPQIIAAKGSLHALYGKRWGVTKPRGGETACLQAVRERDGMSPKT